MRIAAIVAMSDNSVIGKENQLPWKLPADLKHFKEITLGHAILMGRKTYQSIGRPLPGRRNIVITRDANFQAPGCEVVHSIEAALTIVSESDEIFVIGGALLYKAMLPRVQRLYLTRVHCECEGDAYFPELNPAEWQERDTISHPADAQNSYPYSFILLERK